METTNEEIRAAYYCAGYDAYWKVEDGPDRSDLFFSAATRAAWEAC